MTAQRRQEAMFESLDGLGARVYRQYMDGNKSDARILFRTCPWARQGYLAYTIIGLHMCSSGNPHVSDLDDFFKSVTD